MNVQFNEESSHTQWKGFRFKRSLFMIWRICSAFKCYKHLNFIRITTQTSDQKYDCNFTWRLTVTFLHETRSTQPSFKQAEYTFCLLRDRRLTFLVFESINAETLHCQGHYTSIYPINAPHVNDLNIDWMFLSTRTLHFLLKYLRCNGLHATPIGWYRFYDEFCKLYDTIRLEWV